MKLLYATLFAVFLFGCSSEQEYFAGDNVEFKGNCYKVLQVVSKPFTHQFYYRIRVGTEIIPTYSVELTSCTPQVKQ